VRETLRSVVLMRIEGDVVGMITARSSFDWRHDWFSADGGETHPRHEELLGSPLQIVRPNPTGDDVVGMACNEAVRRMMSRILNRHVSMAELFEMHEGQEPQEDE